MNESPDGGDLAELVELALTVTDTFRTISSARIARRAAKVAIGGWIRMFVPVTTGGVLLFIAVKLWRQDSAREESAIRLYFQHVSGDLFERIK